MLALRFLGSGRCSSSAPTSTGLSHRRIRRRQMGQWVGACRHEYNHALERRQYEYRNYGFSLAYVPQAKELTVRRAAKNWLEFVPIHALQNALRDLDDAFSRFFKKLCGHPTPRKKFKNDSFTL